MAKKARASSTQRRARRPRRCGSYRLGHEVHFIQARLSWESGPGTPRTIKSVTDDGTISFTDGTHLWHHDPARLRALLRRLGNNVLIGSHGVLKVPRPDGSGEYFFSVAEQPDPCRAETSEVRPGETIVDELIRRGGVMRSGRSVLNEITQSARTGKRATRAKKRK
jgi:hypothetical protein